jgi:nucleoside-diphosphate-sugar epimerase
MRILLTGASGLIGRHVSRLLARTHEVLEVTRPGAADGPNGVSWDLTSPELPASMPSNVDTVVHLAQSVRFRDFPDEAPDIFGVNVASTARLLEWCRKTNVRRFVLASSGGAERLPDAEIGYYLASKRAAELLAHAYRPYFTVIVLRFFFVYGAGQRPTMLIPRIVENVREGRPVRLGGADGLRLNPIHVSDAARAVAAAAAVEGSAVIDVAGPQILTLRDLSETVGAKFARAPIFVSDEAAFHGDLVGDITTMSSILEAPTVTFCSGVEELCVR